MTVVVPRSDRRTFGEVSEMQPVAPGRLMPDVHPAWTIARNPTGPASTAASGSVMSCFLAEERDPRPRGTSATRCSLRGRSADSQWISPA